MTGGPGNRSGRAPRITCVISALSVGGAELVLTALADRWVRMGWSVTILSFGGPRDTPFYRPDPRVVERRLDLLAVSRSPLDAVANNLRRLRRLRRAIRATRPDAIVSFMDRTNVLTLLATVGTPWPVVVSDRTAPEASPGRAWAGLRRLAYQRARRVVVQTASAAAAYPADLRRRLTVIPNPVLDPGTVGVAPRPGQPAPAIGAPADDPGAPRIVALGRLVPAKGFDLLLRAFSVVHTAHPSARLEIWGEGPEREPLERLRASLGLESWVALPGETRTPAATLARGRMAVLSSRLEGFPNVLLEAMVQGIPVVAFACPHGPAEIVRDGIDGRLVPAGDVERLAGAIGDLLADEGRRAALAARAPEVRERFGLERVGRAWDALLLGDAAVEVAGASGASGASDAQEAAP